MKNLPSVIGAVFFLCLSCMAHAYPVRDVVTFNQILEEDDYVTWTHDLTRYGSLPADRRWHGLDFTLVLELRDAFDEPWKEDRERPMYMISRGHGFDFGRVSTTDILITPGDTPFGIGNDGVASGRLTIMSGTAWFGSAILLVDMPTPVPEPTPLLLFGLGLIALSFKRWWLRSC